MKDKNCLPVLLTDALESAIKFALIFAGLNDE